MVRYYTRHRGESFIFWISPSVTSKDGIDFAMLFALQDREKEIIPTHGKKE
jgi:hypothetical protein